MTITDDSPHVPDAVDTDDALSEDDAYKVWFMQQWDAMTWWQKVRACSNRNPFVDTARRARWDLDRARAAEAAAVARVAELTAENEALRSTVEQLQDHPKP